MAGSEKQESLMNGEFRVIGFPKLKHINIRVNCISHCDLHFHNEFELFAVLDGNGSIRRYVDYFPVSRGSILLFNSNEAHEIIAKNGNLIALIIQFSPHFLRDYYPGIRTTVFNKTDLAEFLSRDEINALWGQICDISLRYIEAEPLFELWVVSTLARVVAMLLDKIPRRVVSEKDYQNMKKTTERLNRIISYINENYEYVIRLRDIADMEGITTTHLSHLISKSFGITFQEYLNNKRFEHAVHHISDTAKSLSDVAADSGFSDPKYMVNMFMRRLNCTPHEYRNNPQFVPASDATSKALFEYRYSPSDSIKLLKDMQQILYT